MKTMRSRLLLNRKPLSFHIFSYLLAGMFALLCMLPFWVTLVGSFTAEKYLIFGLNLWPKGFSFEAYEVIFRDSMSILRAYGVTTGLMLVGTPLSLLIVAMAGFVLQNKEFRYRSRLAFFFFFTTLFSGGLIPFYILMTNLGMRNNPLVLILPNLVTVFHIIIVRTYFQHNVPESLGEAAKIDGAGTAFVFWKIYVPLAVPVLATLGLFIAIAFWNQWYYAMLFVTDRRLYPLQYLLYRIFQSAAFARLVAEKTGQASLPMPTEGFKLAMTVVTLGPIVIAYPFAQKYFVSGLTVGAVKG